MFGLSATGSTNIRLPALAVLGEVAKLKHSLVNSGTFQPTSMAAPTHPVKTQHGAKCWQESELEVPGVLQVQCDLTRGELHSFHSPLYSPSQQHLRQYYVLLGPPRAPVL